MCIGGPFVGDNTADVPANSFSLQMDPLESDLSHFRPDPSKFAKLVAGDFTFVRQIAKGINGELTQYTTHHGRQVVVKRIAGRAIRSVVGTETNERKVHFQIGQQAAAPAEDPLAEIGVMEYISRQADAPDHLLRSIGVFAESAPLGPTWLVMDYAEGGDLFELVTSQGPLSEVKACEYTKQLLGATAYLHKHNIAHRDISLENVLLKDGEVRMMDFGMAVQSHAIDGTPLRFFRPVGKDYYKAPEVHVAGMEYVDVLAPAGKLVASSIVQVPVKSKFLSQVKLPATAVPCKPCRAELYGYEPQPADVFAVGICCFVMMKSIPIFQKAVLTDKIFVYFLTYGLRHLLQVWKMDLPSEACMDLFHSTLPTNPAKRIPASECLALPLFQRGAGAMEIASRGGA